MKYIVIILAGFISGCGTIKSLNTEGNEIKIRHSQVNTSCNNIPRVYSGVSYDLCLLNSTRKSSPKFPVIDNLWVISVDVIFSTVADTVVLPYTVYQQIDNGNIQVLK